MHDHIINHAEQNVIENDCEQDKLCGEQPVFVQKSLPCVRENPICTEQCNRGKRAFHKTQPQKHADAEENLGFSAAWFLPEAHSSFVCDIG